MKQILILLFTCILSLSVLSGCHNNAGNGTDTANIGTENKLPDFLVGTWKAEHGWEMDFERDSTISRAVLSLGQIEVRPNKTTKIKGKQGEPGIFEAGNFELEYNPVTRDIYVVITMKYIYAEIGTGKLDGSSEDIFFGHVSQDGKSWEAEWMTQFNLGELRTSPDDPPFNITFTKIDKNNKP